MAHNTKNSCLQHSTKSTLRNEAVNTALKNKNNTVLSVNCQYQFNILELLSSFVSLCKTF